MSDAPATAMALGSEVLGTGRRKKSVARVRVRPGQGKIEINDRSLETYFPSDQQRRAVLAPLEISGKRGQFDISIRVQGGGITGQADACKLGIARAKRALGRDRRRLRGPDALAVAREAFSPAIGHDDHPRTALPQFADGLDHLTAG